MRRIFSSYLLSPLNFQRERLRVCDWLRRTCAYNFWYRLLPVERRCEDVCSFFALCLKRRDRRTATVGTLPAAARPDDFTSAGVVAQRSNRRGRFDAAAETAATAILADDVIRYGSSPAVVTAEAVPIGVAAVVSGIARPGSAVAHHSDAEFRCRHCISGTPVAAGGNDAAPPSSPSDGGFHALFAASSIAQRPEPDRRRNDDTGRTAEVSEQLRRRPWRQVGSGRQRLERVLGMSGKAVGLRAVHVRTHVHVLRVRNQRSTQGRGLVPDLQAADTRRHQDLPRLKHCLHAASCVAVVGCSAGRFGYP